MVTSPHSHPLFVCFFFYLHPHFIDKFTTWLVCQVFLFKTIWKCFDLHEMEKKKKENPLAAALVVIELAVSTEADNSSKVGKSGWLFRKKRDDSGRRFLFLHVHSRSVRQAAKHINQLRFTANGRLK